MVWFFPTSLIALTGRHVARVPVLGDRPVSEAAVTSAAESNLADRNYANFGLQPLHLRPRSAAVQGCGKLLTERKCELAMPAAKGIQLARAH